MVFAHYEQLPAECLVHSQKKNSHMTITSNKTGSEKSPDND